MQSVEEHDGQALSDDTVTEVDEPRSYEEMVALYEIFLILAYHRIDDLAYNISMKATSYEEIIKFFSLPPWVS